MLKAHFGSRAAYVGPLQCCLGYTKLCHCACVCVCWCVCACSLGVTAEDGNARSVEWRSFGNVTTDSKAGTEGLVEACETLATRLVVWQLLAAHCPLGTRQWNGNHNKQPAEKNKAPKKYNREKDNLANWNTLV